MLGSSTRGYRTISSRRWKNTEGTADPGKTTHPQRQYNTSLEAILGTMGENGGRRIDWNFDRMPRTPRAITEGEIGLGTGETPNVVWELRIRRELEVEGWTTCYSDGSGLDDKASGAYMRNCHLGLHDAGSGSEFLGIKATHHDGELSGIAQALKGAREVGMLAILTDSKSTISVLGKLDQRLASPCSEVEARILEELSRRGRDSDTRVVWVKGHKGIKGNEEADKLCREASILGHESERVVTPAGLRAWSKRVRAEARV